MENKFKNYLEDCLEELIDRSIELKEKAELTKDQFDQGISFGYYEILDHLLNQAEIFEIRMELKEKIRSFSPTY